MILIHFMQVKNTTLLVPGPFTLFAPYNESKCYPNNSHRDICGAPKYFKGVQLLKTLDNPYIPRFSVKENSIIPLPRTENEFLKFKVPVIENKLGGFAYKIWEDSFNMKTLHSRVRTDVSKEKVGSTEGQCSTN